MNNQQKKGDSEKKILPFSSANEEVAETVLPKPKRGRPKSSPHDAATQNRIRVQRHRQAKREEDAVPVEIYLPKAWHDWLLNVQGANLREVALEAFSLWLQKKGFPVADTPKRSSTSDT